MATAFLLPLYILTETIRSNYSYYVLTTSVSLSPNFIIFLSELLKLSVAVAVLASQKQGFASLSGKVLSESGLRSILLYAGPGLLYFLNNTIYLNVLPYTSPTLLQVCTLAKLPLTAILHHFLVRRQENRYAWGALAWLSVGLCVFSLPTGSSAGQGWYIAPIAGLSIAGLSAVANIACEKLTQTGEFWESQFWLYAWGFGFSLLTWILRALFAASASSSSEVLTQTGGQRDALHAVELALVTATVGFVIAFILRTKDNLVKLVGKSASLLTVAASQYVLFPTLRETMLTGEKIVGGCVVFVATVMYHLHKDREFQSIVLRHDEEEDLLQCRDKDEEPVVERRMQQAISWQVFADTMTLGYLPHLTQHPPKTILLAILLPLLPSPLTDFYNHVPAKRLHPTSYLDGMRGIAALFVFFTHSIFEWYPRSLYGYDGGGDSWLVQLPWIRLLISGASMVAIFFVVSGFSIAYKPLFLLRSNNKSTFLEAMASFCLRRHMRLFLPIMGISFWMAVATYCAQYSPSPHGNIDTPPQAASFSSQLWHWMLSVLYFANPFRPVDLQNLWGDGFPYDLNLWTIPVEFRGSMVVFLLLLAFSATRASTRMWFMGTISVYCLWTGYWDLSLFITGALFAELHHKRSESSDGQRRLFGYEVGALVKKCFWAANLVGSTFILSMPDTPSRGGYGFMWIWNFSPARYSAQPDIGRFWPVVGAVWFVFTVGNENTFQRPFETKVARWLGKVSYSLYVIHGSVLRTVGRYVVWRCLNWTGREDAWSYGAGVGMGYVVVLVVTFWLADVSARLVDEASVTGARWFYEWVRVEEGEGKAE